MINTIKLFSDYDTRLGSKQSDILVIVEHCSKASKHRRKLISISLLFII